ncbi:hypothetical protein ACQPZX_18375 [Actinoplanes sp. CA-142083]|uniref:hypothetical protein n=1 Tax=Actinoplanes sp. CA-142083 TaxID=3239903 RepID=UPI003D936EA1
MILRAGAALAATVLGIGLALVTPGVALAGPQRECRVEDRRMTELSGLVATESGYVVVNDGSDDPAARKIFYLDKKCQVTRTVSYPSRPRDTEDMGLAPDGTLWVADIGDNDANRDTVGLWRLPPGAKKPELFRLSYPDGAHDAEALLITPAGTPIVVTKTVAEAGVYEPVGALRAGRTTALKRLASVTLPITTTSNPFSFAGGLVITGGAVSPDGRHAVLRTYADAFEFDVVGGDVAGAITKGDPRQIPLPNEPQGESVAYTPDGTAILTISEVSRQPAGTAADLLRYAISGRPAPPPTTSLPSPSSKPASRAPSRAATTQARQETAEDRLPAGALITGGVLVLAAAALVGLLIARRSRR